jgi:CRISPR-associated protein Cmr2
LGVKRISSAYVALTLGGVQEFIAASRRTADLWVGSRLMSRLCQVALDEVLAAGGSPVVPTSPVSQASWAALPNRLFAEAPVGRAAEVAGAVARAVRAEWERLAAVTHGSLTGVTAQAVGTFPVVRWVSWEPSGPAGTATTSCADAWWVLGSAMDARKRVRSFRAVAGRGGDLCSLCGMRDGSAMAHVRRLHVADGERLCPVCVVKRDQKVATDLAGARAAFPSTASVASAPFRARVLAELTAGGAGSPLLAAVSEHRRAVRAVAEALGTLGARSPGGEELPGALAALEALAGGVADEGVLSWARLDGTWCFVDTWQPESLLHENGLTIAARDPRLASLEDACARGRAACGDMYRGLAGPDGVAVTPATYLAVVVQDADDMGSHLAAPDDSVLAGRPLREWHGEVSSALAGVAAKQSGAFEDSLGRAVYAGGDDLLGLLPAAHGLTAASRCRALFSEETTRWLGSASASSAVVFFHHSYPLQEALQRARDALRTAKDAPAGREGPAGDRGRAAWRRTRVGASALVTARHIADRLAVGSDRRLPRSAVASPAGQHVA